MTVCVKIALLEEKKVQKDRAEVILGWTKKGLQDSRSGILKCGHKKTKTMCITPQEVNNKRCQDLKKWVNNFTELGKRRNSAIVCEQKSTNKGGLG